MLISVEFIKDFCYPIRLTKGTEMREKDIH
jgi:hypothetical protein